MINKNLQTHLSAVDLHFSGIDSNGFHRRGTWEGRRQEEAQAVRQGSKGPEQLEASIPSGGLVVNALVYRCFCI